LENNIDKITYPIIILSQGKVQAILEDKRYKHLKSMEKELSQIYNSIRNALDLLEMKNEKYEYLSNKVEPSILPEEITVDIPYNREKYIHELIQKLENLSYNLIEKKYKVVREKTSFESFCNNSI
jgi:hypothetical protein